MLDEPDWMTAHTRYLVGLYLPLRARIEWAKPASVADITEYLRLHGIECLELFQWLSIADSEAMGWMGEQQKASLDAARRRPH